MLNCREVSCKASLYLDGELPWRERVAMRLHLLMCNKCRRFVRQLAGLIRAIGFMYRQASPEEVESILAHVSKSMGGDVLGEGATLPDIETSAGGDDGSR